MVLFGLLCGLGIRGGLVLGIAAAEILTSYWNSRYTPSHPPKVYAFNRRIHHGEIGALLALSSLLLRRTTPVASIAAIVTGIGLGLVNDDRADIMEWFRLKKKEMERDQDKQNEEKAVQKQQEAAKQRPHDVEEKQMGICKETDPSKKIPEKFNLEHMRIQIRNLINIQSQSLEEIDLQIRRSQKQFL
ncbi:MAG TPA: hypothetical protein VI278_16220 [Nitrososphaeraceae archaeon]